MGSQRMPLSRPAHSPFPFRAVSTGLGKVRSGVGMDAMEMLSARPGRAGPHAFHLRQGPLPAVCTLQTPRAVMQACSLGVRANFDC
ncbi:uncharacterized protein CCOS01_10198 [Colletotrichum costaricense]|uniref:Uncharacterized protein n=1 Tax=Colletotrichum costaricense TaxID=1209916 RepID=A0AAJ0DYG3_9PEZI|nr:uncharacterized protein CCOS01_10198 [Colletotrichum costaricense]KAK1522486.1 hypothetical protein CCOS01_10198 [Colletotrichum costaricense]